MRRGGPGKGASGWALRPSAGIRRRRSLPPSPPAAHPVRSLRPAQRSRPGRGWQPEVRPHTGARGRHGTPAPPTPGPYLLRAASSPTRSARAYCSAAPAPPLPRAGAASGVSGAAGGGGSSPLGAGSEDLGPGAASQQETTPRPRLLGAAQRAPRAASAALSLRKRIPPGPRQPRSRRVEAEEEAGSSRPETKELAWAGAVHGGGGGGARGSGGRGPGLCQGLRGASVSFSAKGWGIGVCTNALASFTILP